MEIRFLETSYFTSKTFNIDKHLYFYLLLMISKNLDFYLLYSYIHHHDS